MTFLSDMKKIILMLMMALVCCVSVNAQSYSRNGNTFTTTAKARTAAEPTKTKFVWTDSKNNSYPIYMSTNGSCFVIKTSAKTGKEYRNYLGKDISQEICKELGVEYKGKK